MCIRDSQAAMLRLPKPGLPMAAVRLADIGEIGVARLAPWDDRRWEAPTHHQQFADAVRGSPDDGGFHIGKNAREGRYVARNITLHAGQLTGRILGLGKAVEIT